MNKYYQFVKIIIIINKILTNKNTKNTTLN